MGSRGLILLNAILASFPLSSLADAIVEGRVQLPAARAAPVMAKRYEIVTTGNVLKAEPPRAVVYLEGSFMKQNSSITKQIGQKDLAFLPALMPVRVGTKI